MWIKNTYEPQYGNHIKIPEITERVEFSENGKANVTEQVADLLCSNVDHIEKCKEKNKDETKNDNEEERDE